MQLKSLKNALVSIRDDSKKTVEMIDGINEGLKGKPTSFQTP